MHDISLKETGLFSVPKTKKSRKGPSTTYQHDAAVRRERSPSFQCLKSFVQRNIASEDGGKLSVHYNAEPQTSELLLKTIVAANQLSI